jgi:hypothetical protein
MKALVFRNKIVQIGRNEFPVHKALRWIDLTGISPQPKIGWSYDGMNFSPPPPLPEPAPDPNDELDAALAEVKAGLANVSTVADVVTALNDMLDAMRGQGGRAGRGAGRPV